MEVFWILYLGLVVGAGFLADSKGRSVIAWVLWTLCFPLIAFIVLLVISANKECPSCKNKVNKDVLVCHVCKYKF